MQHPASLHRELKDCRKRLLDYLRALPLVFIWSHQGKKNVSWLKAGVSRSGAAGKGTWGWEIRSAPLPTASLG